MKRIMVIGALVLSILGLAGCSAPASPEPTSTQSEEVVPAIQEGIPGAERIKLRYERLQAGGNAVLYCVDNVAYLHLYGAMVATPQYDSLCKSER